VWYRAVLKEGNGNEGEVPVLSKNDERYLLQALEIENVLRACLYRYTRNNSDVDELPIWKLSKFSTRESRSKRS
jgi:hypothetical protein